MARVQGSAANTESPPPQKPTHPPNTEHRGTRGHREKDLPRHPVTESGLVQGHPVKAVSSHRGNNPTGEDPTVELEKQVCALRGSQRPPPRSLELWGPPRRLPLGGERKGCQAAYFQPCLPTQKRCALCFLVQQRGGGLLLLKVSGDSSA